MSRTGTGTPTSQSNAQPIFPLVVCLEFGLFMNVYFAAEQEFAICNLITSATGSLQRPEARDGQDGQCEASLGTRPLSINPRNGSEGEGDGDHHGKPRRFRLVFCAVWIAKAEDLGVDGLVQNGLRERPGEIEEAPKQPKRVSFGGHGARSIAGLVCSIATPKPSGRQPQYVKERITESPQTKLPPRLDSAAAMPTIKLAVETMPSLAPRTAARSQPMRCER